MSTPRHAVLLVSGDLGAQATLQSVLDESHPMVRTADAAEGIAIARGETPALVLLDARTADLDAAEFCRVLRSGPDAPGVPILLMVKDEQDAFPALADGASDCLAWPLRKPLARSRLRNYLDLGRCIETLRRISLVDRETGIAGRSRFDAFLALEWRRNLRNGTMLSLVLMALDDFEAFQAHNGAAIVENSLRRIAGAFQEATQRAGDLVAVYTRGLFACVLPETDRLGAVSVAERMRAELATLAIPRGGPAGGKTLTMSAGAVTRMPTPEGESEELISLAERTLAYARRTGGDRVVFEG